MQLSRQRKKEAEKGKPKTRNDALEREVQRKKWREQKRKQWENMHPQAKRRFKEKRRARDQKRKDEQAAKEKAKSKEQVPVNSTPNKSSTSEGIQEVSTPSVAFSNKQTPSAERQARCRFKKALPNSPSKFIRAVNSIIAKSPRKLKLFEETRPQTPEHHIGQRFKDAVNRLRQKHCSADRKARKVLLDVCKVFGSCRQRSRELNLNIKTLKRHESSAPSAPKRSKTAEAAAATAYFEDVATTLPDKKLVSKKTGKPAAVLNKPLKDVYSGYVEKGGKMSFSSFAKCRPKNVKKMCQARLRQCLCEYCTNVDLKCTVINSLAVRYGSDLFLRNEYHVVGVTVCDNKKKACAYRTCSECSVGNLDNHLQELLRHREEVTWHHWESRLVERNGKKSSHKILVTRKGLVEELIGELKNEASFLSEHLFRADWQQAQYTAMKHQKPFPHNSILMVMDFTENFACTYQQEVQAAHWNKDLVTVHPTVTFYKCPTCEDETINESLVFISPDTVHDHHAVHHFTGIAVSHLKETRGIPLEHIIQWTDGCSSQYKSKGPFSDISHALDDFGATLERNFFGSRHGKSPSDGESGVVKHQATQAIIAGNAIISNARELFDYCSQSALNKQPPSDGCPEKHFLRSFFWVGSNDIKRNRNDRSVLTVKGTRSFHSVKCIEAKSIMARHLTCSCQPCSSGVGVCVEEVAGSWSTHNLRNVVSQTRRCRINPPSPDLQEPSSPDASNISLPSPEFPLPRLVLPPAAEVPCHVPASHPSAAEGHAESAGGPQPVTYERTGPQEAVSPPLLIGSREMTKGAWVRVTFGVQSGRTEYIGKVTEIDVDTRELQVKFLRNRGSYWSWPQVDDVAWMTVDDNVEIMNNPTISGRDQFFFD